METKAIVEQVKDSMRIRHDKLDADIRRNIEAAMGDMKMRGIAAEQGGNLVGKACELYCKWQYDHLGNGDAFRRNYEGLRDAMSLSTEYSGHGEK